MRPVDSPAAARRIGKAGLDALFPVGSLWHYSPEHTSIDTIVRVLSTQAYKRSEHSGMWFIRCEVVAPAEIRDVRAVDGFPPHALLAYPEPAAPAEPCLCSSLTAELETVKAELEGARAANATIVSQRDLYKRTLNKIIGSATEALR